MAILTVQSTTSAGIAPTFTAVGATGDTFRNTGNELVIVKTTTTATSVTITSPVACGHGFMHDVVIALGAGVEQVIGKLPINRFNDSTNSAKITCSVQTGVTIAVVRPN